MLTREILRQEMARSEELEAQVYRLLTSTLYQSLQAPLKDLYDRTFAATDLLTVLTGNVIRGDPPIIKILRYCLAPTVSQMRLGQIIDLSTTADFERDENPKTPTS